MHNDTRFHVDPTFPIDAQRIRRRKILHVIKSPITSAGIIAALLGTVFMGWRMPGLLGLMGAAAAGLTAFWKSRSASLESLAIHDLVRESNVEQDTELLRVITHLRQRGHHQYAISLGKFLMIKQRIEHDLHQDGSLTPKKKEIESLVDSLCAAICDELTQATNVDQRVAKVLTSGDRQELDKLNEERMFFYDRIMRAYDSLYQTHARLHFILSPGMATTDVQEATDVLDALIEQLREENHVAERVQDELDDRVLRREE